MPRARPKVIGKFCKYEKKYRKAWEAENLFKGWLKETPEEQVMPQAYCSYCDCYLRAQKNDLSTHATSKKHLQAAECIPSAKGKGGGRQSTLENLGVTIKSAESKKTDLTLAVLIACHSSIKTIDHLGSVLKNIGKITGSKSFENLRMHRTKCSKLICNVVAPAMLDEQIADIGNEYYSIIVDESTDTTACKWLAIMVKYYSFKKKEMIVDLLGIVETPRATAQHVYEAFTSYMSKTGLRLRRMLAIGTDGGLNLCGSNNSLFAYLKMNDCPNLHLFKCICHKCASTASKCLPPSLEFLLRKTRGWFSHSSVRKEEYEELKLKLKKELTGGAKPPQLVRLAATRWLSWYGAVKAHLTQYKLLLELFKRVAQADSREQCHMAHTLAKLHDDGAHFLYLKFLQPILRELTALNVAFQRSSGDIVKLYTDLKAFIFSVAGKVLKADSIRQTQSNMVRLTELQALQAALQRKENYRPTDLVKYGEGFYQAALELKLPDK